MEWRAFQSSVHSTCRLPSAVTTFLLAATLAAAPVRADLIANVRDLGRLTVLQPAAALLSWIQPVDLLRDDLRGSLVPFDPIEVHRFAIQARLRASPVPSELFLPCYTNQGALEPAFDPAALHGAIDRILSEALFARAVDHSAPALVQVVPGPRGSFVVTLSCVLEGLARPVIYRQAWLVERDGGIGGGQPTAAQVRALVDAAQADPRGRVLFSRARPLALQDRQGTVVPGTPSGIFARLDGALLSLDLSYDLRLSPTSVLQAGGTFQAGTRTTPAGVSGYVVTMADVGVLDFPELVALRDHPLFLWIRARSHGEGYVFTEKHDARWMVKVKGARCCFALFEVAREIKVLASDGPPSLNTPRKLGTGR